MAEIVLIFPDIAAPGAPLVFVPHVVVPGQVGVPYSDGFTATGGDDPYEWTVTSGALPDGLSLGLNTGAIGGTPTVAGTFVATIQVEDDASAVQSLSFTWTMLPAITAVTVLDSSVPNGELGIPYVHDFTAVGGTPPYTWSKPTGSFPTGLALSGRRLSGTPTVVQTASFTIRATDTLAAFDDSGTFNLTIANNQLAISTGSLPSARVGVVYAATIATSGGTAPRTVTFVSGNPAWLTLTGSTGALGGTPTGSDVDETIVFRVTDSASPANVVDKTFTLRVRVAAATGRNAFYTAYSASAFKANSLRTQANIDSLSKLLLAPSNHAFIRYDDPLDDDFDEPQDGAKLVIPPTAWRRDRASYPSGAFTYGVNGTSAGWPSGGTSANEGLNNNTNLIIPIGANPTAATNPWTSLTIVWDWWWDDSWHFNKGGIQGYKTFFVYAGTGTGSTEQYFIRHEDFGTPHSIANGEIGSWHFGGDFPSVSGMVDIDPYDPPGLNAEALRTYDTHHGKWSRYWLHFEFNKTGADFQDWIDSTSATEASMSTVTADRVSMWFADEDRTPVKLLWRVPIQRRATWTMASQFRIAFDQSNSTIAGDALQQINLGDIATGNTFTLTVPAYTNVRLGVGGSQETTAAITYAANMAPAIATALNALTGIDIAQVAKIGTTGQLYEVRFSGAPSGQSAIESMTVTPTGFTPQGVRVSVPGVSPVPGGTSGKNTEQWVGLGTIGASDTFTLTVPAFGAFTAETTGPIAYSATTLAADIKTALQALTSVDVVNVTRLFTNHETYKVEFTGNSGKQPIGRMTLAATGFVPDGVWRKQDGATGQSTQQAGLVTAYASNVLMFKNLGALDDALDPDFFARPQPGDDR